MPPNGPNDAATAQALANLAEIMSRIEIRLGAQAAGEVGAGGVALTEAQRTAEAKHYSDSQVAVAAILKQTEAIKKTHALDLDYLKKSEEFYSNQAKILRQQIRTELQGVVDDQGNIVRLSAERLAQLEGEVKALEQQSVLWESASSLPKDIKPAFQRLPMPLRAWGHP